MFKLSRSFLVCSLLVVQWLVIPPVFALSDAVKIDIATDQLIEALENGSDTAVIKATGKLRALKVDDSRLNFFDGQALFNTKQYNKAQSALEGYVNATGRKGEFYKDAVKLLGKLESMTTPTTRQKTISKIKPAVGKPQQNFGTDSKANCPTGIAPNLLSNSQTYSAQDPRAKGTQFHKTACLYGEKSQFSIDGTHHTGDAQTACSHPELNPKLAIAKIREKMGERVANMKLFNPIQIMPVKEVEAFGFHYQDVPGSGEMIIYSVIPGSAAAEADILPSDIIVAINGDEQAVANQTSAMNAFASTGKQVTLTLKRTTLDNEFIRQGLANQANGTQVKLAMDRPPEVSTIIEVNLTKFKFTPPQVIVLQTGNSLAIVNMQLPFVGSSQASYQDWINVGQTLLTSLETQAIVCD